MNGIVLKQDVRQRHIAKQKKYYCAMNPKDWTKMIK